jgi:hypothetical protein
MVRNKNTFMTKYIYYTQYAVRLPTTQHEKQHLIPMPFLITY